MSLRDCCGLWHGWNANRFGGSIQRKLHVIRHYAQLRFGYHYDSGRIASRGLRLVDRQVHPGQRQLRDLQQCLRNRLGNSNSASDHANGDRDTGIQQHHSAQSLSVTIKVAGTGTTPTGSVVLSSGSYTSSATTLSSGSATITIPAGSLATGSDTLTAKYTPDSASSATYNSASGTASVTVTAGKRTAVTVNIDVLANRHTISPYRLRR